MKKVAVISDLHIGHAARSKDMCPHLESKAVEDGFRLKFVKFVTEKKIKADYLFIPGDISHTSQPNEIELASEIISEIATALGVTTDHIFFVPGNHDVDWQLLKLPDPTGMYKSMRYNALKDARWMFDGIHSASTPSFYDLPYFSVWDLSDIVVVGYNSSWHDDPAVAVHHGSFLSDSIARLDELLLSIGSLADKYKIFMVHHHPLPYSDPLADIPEFSIMTNSDMLMTYLQKKKFDFFIHGHKHKPHFKTISTDSSFPLVVLSSGSFSSELDTRWSGSVNNQFHILSINGRDSENKCTYGALESWTYTTASGWGGSQLHNGIRHKVPYGTYVQPNVLKKSLYEIISTLFNENKFVTWSQILKTNPVYEFLPPELIIMTLDEISSELGCTRIGEPPDEIVLLKIGVYDVKS
jgi:UDP-2,3-diacylglucosamine pyrophosphatase LpxH